MRLYAAKKLCRSDTHLKRIEISCFIYCQHNLKFLPKKFGRYEKCYFQALEARKRRNRGRRQIKNVVTFP